MSILTHWADKTWPLRSPAARPIRAQSALIFWAIVGFALTAASRLGKLIVDVSEVLAEARMQRAKIEVELYRNRYRHSSKNDDDLPVVRPSAVARPQRRPIARPIRDAAKRAYPVILTLAISAVLLAAMMALRLAIWMPALPGK
jgi:hypothetical protein